MSLLRQTETRLTSALEEIELSWWVEIVTQSPKCTYYFGPFRTAKEADFAQLGYIEDLTLEQAQIASVVVKECQPQVLTIVEDEL